MSHLIDTTKGHAAFVATGQPAWHNLGVVFDKALTTRQALEQGGLDFTVIKAPNIHRIEADPMIEVVATDSFFTYRTDANKVLGSKLGRDYEVLQNVEALEFIDEILQSGKATLETAGVIDGGRKVFMCLKINRDIYVGEDKVAQYLLICNSHDGSFAITVMFTNIRVVCHNTLSAALRGAHGATKIRHTKKADERLKQALRVLKFIDENADVNEQNYTRMKDIKISKEDLMNYFGNVFFNPLEVKQLQSGNPYDKTISAQKQNIIQRVADYAVNGQGQLEALGDDLNMWYAYNAVTGYTARKQFKTPDDRANSMLFGHTGKIIHDAGVLALNPEKIEPLHRVFQNTVNLN